MTPLTERPRGELLLDLLLRALRVHDERLNALATELLGRCGQAPIRRLVGKRLTRRTGPPTACASSGRSGASAGLRTSLRSSTCTCSVRISTRASGPRWRSC